MLGLLKAYKPELRIKEYELYKAVYCSLCRYLGRKYGVLTRFTLSYDFTFLALLNMSLADRTGEIEHKRCVCNPLKKCSYCKDCGDLLSMPAAVSVIMTYYSIADNAADERGMKRLCYRFLKSVYKGAHKKAAATYPDIEKSVAEYVDKQTDLEKAGCNDLDAAAQPTADVLSKVFPLCSDNENDKRALARLGYCMGRYIYLTDAMMDVDGDRKNGRYNPLLFLETDAKERAERNIYMCINESADAFELINIKQYKNILGNIICMGLEDSMKRSKTDE